MVRKNAQIIFTFLCSLLLLVSCTYNPLSNHNELTGSATGTAMGAGIGAGSMYLLNAPHALIAAAGLGGASMGYYVTSLRFASGGVIQAGGVVYTLGDYVMIEIPSDKLFDVNTAEIEPGAEPILNSAIAVLNRYPSNHILISGSTSGMGRTRYELELSESRARQVAAYFWGNGINGFRNNGQDLHLRKLIYTGYGDYFPIASPMTAAGIRQNNRIQITGFPSCVQLRLDKRHRLFGNIGGQQDQAPLLKE
jgi:outer membrane protein OmpA-like peptidoglycan-associated protein